MYNFSLKISKTTQLIQRKTWENMAQTAKKTLKNHFESYVNVVVEPCVETR